VRTLKVLSSLVFLTAAVALASLLDALFEPPNRAADAAVFALALAAHVFNSVRTKRLLERLAPHRG